MRVRLVALIFTVCFLLIAAGCGTARLWGTKTSNSPARLGGDISIPLGQ